MSVHQNIAAGIDVSKETLDYCCGTSKPRKIANSEAGLKALVQEFKKSLASGAPVFLEATGGYERLACRRLVEAGFQARLLNPYQVRQLAKSRGVKAKTDSMDAAFLAQNGEFLPSSEPESVLKQEARDISRRIDDCKTEIGILKKKLAMPCVPQVVIASLKRNIFHLNEESILLEKAFAEHLKGTEFESDFKLAQTVPYVGPCLARVLIVELPANFKTQSREQIASFAGLAPMDDSSGKKDNSRTIQKGNAHIKRALYMPAVGLIWREEWAQKLKDRLCAKGTHPNKAIVAVMRKHMLHTVAVLKRGSPWQAEPRGA